MPIYEFYCGECNTIFNFFARRVDTTSQPDCPRCRRRKLQRQVSLFAAASRAKDGNSPAAGEGEDSMPPGDEIKMERAVEALASEAERIDENDPRQAAGLMKKFSKMTGMEFGAGMQEAVRRMEDGEDPEAVEAEMGDAIEKEEPFILSGGKGGAGKVRRRPPARDTTLYEL